MTPLWEIGQAIQLVCAVVFLVAVVYAVAVEWRKKGEKR